MKTLPGVKRFLIVSRHPATVSFLRKVLPVKYGAGEVTVKQTYSPGEAEGYDVVAGNLPAGLIADVNECGAVFVLVALPPGLYRFAELDERTVEENAELYEISSLVLEESEPPKGNVYALATVDTTKQLFEKWGWAIASKPEEVGEAEKYVLPGGGLPVALELLGKGEVFLYGLVGAPRGVKLGVGELPKYLRFWKIIEAEARKIYP